jgi:hypothetical protein
MPQFATLRLPEKPTTTAPDGSNVRARTMAVLRA